MSPRVQYHAEVNDITSKVFVPGSFKHGAKYTAPRVAQCIWGKSIHSILHYLSPSWKIKVRLRVLGGKSINQNQSALQIRCVFLSLCVSARFIQAVSELEFLGFIKSTKQKTDHVARLTWGGCWPDDDKSAHMQLSPCLNFSTISEMCIYPVLRYLVLIKSVKVTPGVQDS